MRGLSKTQCLSKIYNTDIRKSSAIDSLKQLLLQYQYLPIVPLIKTTLTDLNLLLNSLETHFELNSNTMQATLEWPMYRNLMYLKDSPVNFFPYLF